MSTTEDSGFDEETRTLTLNFENCIDDDGISTINAGRPYLIRWTNTSGTLENPIFDDVTITATSPEDDNIFGENGEITFIGTFANQTFETENRSILFLGAENTLYFPQPSGVNMPNIGAFRAYFQLNGITAGDLEEEGGSVRAFVLNFGDDNPSGINSLIPASSPVGEGSGYYTLDGRKLSSKPTQRGIYINNKRKIIIK